MYVNQTLPDPLRPYVRRILVANQPDPIEVSSDVRPTGYMFLGFLFRGYAQAKIGDEIEIEVDPTNEGLHVSGQVVAKNITINYQGSIGHVLIEFTALGCFELLGIEGENAVDQCKPPQYFNPNLASVFTKIAGFKEGRNFDQALASVLESLTLLAETPQPAPDFLHQGLAEMEKHVGQVNLGEMCKSLDISHRHFTRLFTKLVGQSPKRFCRILQLNRALQALIDEDATFIAGIASEAGFSDQSHFNRVFRDLLMTNPLDFLNSDQLLLRLFLAERARP